MRPGRSSVGLCVLSLLEERASYPYEVATRFVVRYGDLFGSRHQNIYTAFDRLEARGLIVPAPTVLPGARRRGSDRQPKVCYAATAAGAEQIRRWLSSPIPASDARRELTIRLRSTRPDDREATLRLLHLFERALLDQARPDPTPPRGIVDELLREAEDMGIREQLRWIATARHRLSGQPAAG